VDQVEAELDVLLDSVGRASEELFGEEEVRFWFSFFWWTFFFGGFFFLLFGRGSVWRTVCVELCLAVILPCFRRRRRLFARCIAIAYYIAA
jgi:hypothetical protein